MNPPPTVLHILDPQELALRPSDLEQYLWDVAKKMSEFVKDYCPEASKGGVAYTVFQPTDITFAHGNWAHFSPTATWGVTDDEKRKVLLSSLLYYSLFTNVPPYTELWLQQVSSTVPLNIQVLFTSKESATVMIDHAMKLLNIKLSNETYIQLSNLLDQFFGTFKNYNLKDLYQDIGLREFNGLFIFDFRKIKDVLDKNPELSSRVHNSVSKIQMENELDPIVKSLGESLANEQALSKQIEADVKGRYIHKSEDLYKDLAWMLLKIVLIGHRPACALRLLNPKLYKSDKRYLGCFAGIIRVYDKEVLEENLMSLYPLAFPLVNNIGFRVASTYIYGFMLGHALRSAIAAIMARNMSHMHGSHIEPGLQHKMETFDEEIKKTLRSRNILNLDSTDSCLIYAVREEAYRQLSYCRQRKQDLIARTTTEWPPWGCGLDFYSSVIVPFVKNPLLLHFINLSDGIGLLQTSIRYGYAENGTVSWATANMVFPKNGNSRNLMNNELGAKTSISFLLQDLRLGNIAIKTDSLKSWLVRIRDADIGVQSFYSFLEGMMRNSARHRNQDDAENHLQLRIVLARDEQAVRNLYGNDDAPILLEDDRFCYVLLSTNLDRLMANGKKRTIKEDEADKPLLDFLRDRLKVPIIDETGEITAGAWGLKEMKICAAFLSGARPEDANSQEQSFLWVHKAPAKLWEDSYQNDRFAYIIRLEKPRYVLAVVPEGRRPPNSENWREKGIEFTTPDRLRDTEQDYDFLYIDQVTQESVNSILQTEHTLPQRLVTGGLDLSELTPERFLCKVYDLHLRRFLQHEYKICIYFDDDETAMKWQDWWDKLGTSDRPERTDFYAPKVTKFSDVENEFDKDDGTRKIMILRHKGIKSLSELWRKNKANKLHYQQWATYSDPFFSFLTSVDPNTLGFLILRQVIESAVLNVLVVDERVAQILTTAKSPDASDVVRLEEKLYWMGIYVAKAVKVNEKEFNYIGNENSRRMQTVDIQSLLDGRFQFEDFYSPHILLIHATRLTEIAGALKISREQVVDKLKEKVPYVIVHSGRSKTKGDIPVNVPFLEYSTLQRYLLQEPSKYYLVQITLSAKGG